MLLEDSVIYDPRILGHTSSLEGPPLDQAGPLPEFARNGWSQAIGPLQDVLSDTSAGLPPLALTGMSPGIFG